MHQHAHSVYKLKQWRFNVYGDRSLSLSRSPSRSLTIFLLLLSLSLSQSMCVCDEYVCRACSFISLPKTMAFLVWLARNRIGASPKRYFPYSFDSLFIWLNSFGRYTSVLLTSSTLRLSSLLVYSVIVRYIQVDIWAIADFTTFRFSSSCCCCCFSLFSIQFQCSFLLFFFYYFNTVFWLFYANDFVW